MASATHRIGIVFAIRSIVLNHTISVFNSINI